MLFEQRGSAAGARRAGLAHRAGERPMSAPASSTLPVAAPRLAGKTAIISGAGQAPGLTVGNGRAMALLFAREGANLVLVRSEEHTSELQSLMRISYAVFCLQKKKLTTSTMN